MVYYDVKVLILADFFVNVLDRAMAEIARPMKKSF
jgi:hypothetical protein